MVCPKCGSYVGDKDLFCKNCGYDIVKNYNSTAQCSTYEENIIDEILKLSLIPRLLFVFGMVIFVFGVIQIFVSISNKIGFIDTIVQVFPFFIYALLHVSFGACISHIIEIKENIFILNKYSVQNNKENELNIKS